MCVHLFACLSGIAPQSQVQSLLEGIQEFHWKKTTQDLGMHEGGACEGRIAGLSANMSLEGSVRERG